MPAARPPTTRAPNRMVSVGANAATSEAGIVMSMPRTIISLRPYRSPSAPNQSTDAARPSEYPTAMRSSVVWDESNDAPIDGRATLATDRLRLATAATRMSDPSTILAFGGAVPSPSRRRSRSSRSLHCASDPG